MRRLNEFEKDLLKSSVPSLVFLSLFFTGIWLLPGKGYASYLSLLYVLVFGTYLLGDLRKKTNPSFIKYFKAFIYTGLAYTLFYYAGTKLGGLGFIGTLIIVAGIAGYRLLKNRLMFLKGMRNIEEQLFGASLDKENWVEIKPSLKVKKK